MYVYMYVCILQCDFNAKVGRIPLPFSEQVNYETLGFLEKNRDTLKLDVSQLLKTSENVIVQSLFETPLSRTGGLSPASTVNKAPPSATPLFSRKGPPMVYMYIIPC